MQTYAALISGYCETGNLAAARGLLDVMTANGLDPGFLTYTALVAGKEAHAVLFVVGRASQVLLYSLLKTFCFLCLESCLL